MKIIAAVLLALTSCSLALKENEVDRNDVKLQVPDEISKKNLQLFDHNFDKRPLNGAIIARVNEYADQVLNNIGNFSVRRGLDPANLTDIKQRFLASSIALTEGRLNGISTVSRTGDVVLSYERENDGKKLVIRVPIIFDNLGFDYNFHVIVLLIGPKGKIHGKIHNFKMDIEMEFDFNTYQFKTRKVSTKDTGHISLTFSGMPVVDTVADILSQFVTTVLHPILNSFISNILKTVLNLVFGMINKIIRSIFSPPEQLIDLLVKSLVQN